MDNLIKAHGKGSQPLLFLEKVFPKLSNPKIKMGLFVSSQIRKIINSELIATLGKDQADCWNSLQAVAEGFLENRRRKIEK